MYPFNTKLVEQLIEAISENPKHYTQLDWGINLAKESDRENIYDWRIIPSCKTPACIAGHVMSLTDEGKLLDWEGFDATRRSLEQAEIETRERAKVKLGLSHDQAHALFCAHWPHVWVEDNGEPLPLINPNIPHTYRIEPNSEQAVKALTRLLEYGFSHQTFSDYNFDKARADYEGMGVCQNV